jgi:hypothetical protein
MLYNLLRAYALYDNESGYPQGLAYISASLLLHINDEEATFWCLMRLMSPPFNLRLLFADNYRVIKLW